MLQLFLCLLVASLAVGENLPNEEYGLGKIEFNDSYMLEKYDVVIFVNDDMYNLGTGFEKIEAALTRYNGVGQT